MVLRPRFFVASLLCGFVVFGNAVISKFLDFGALLHRSLVQYKKLVLPNKVFRPIRFSLYIKEWGHGNAQQTVTGQGDQRPGDRKLKG